MTSTRATRTKNGCTRITPPISMGRRFTQIDADRSRTTYKKSRLPFSRFSRLSRFSRHCDGTQIDTDRFPPAAASGTVRGNGMLEYWNDGASKICQTGSPAHYSTIPLFHSPPCALRLAPTACCHLSSVFCPLSSVLCLLSSVFCRPPTRLTRERRSRGSPANPPAGGREGGHPAEPAGRSEPPGLRASSW
jgi:hypothetical protein